MTDLDKLIEALEAGAWPEDWRDVTRALTLHPDERHILAKRAYSGSLDAALALHEALLPGWRWGRLVTHDVMMVSRESGQYSAFSAEGTCPARALLLAILRAYKETMK